jgi:tRNA (cmo5U34)-methyltransferase
MNNNEFDNKARGWDQESIHWERSEAIAKRIEKMIPTKPGMKAMEYGAGTGILSSMLADKFTEITLMDNSSEMIKVIEEKIENLHYNHLKSLLYNLEAQEYHAATFDCIFTQMVLHHVVDTDLILNRFYQLLNTGGYLVIADLYTEDGSFHSNGFTGHNGFDVEVLQNILAAKGFTSIVVEPCFVIKRSEQTYPVFFLLAQKQ